ncbi:hypothetical protein TVAG_214080 [Trichomonas vaginalis G3]|uniref:Uncharacterized protein n=1 Tax=Trichomonas vaginalis (strain ATCC PRA-98 / G3) TaxID=412133 RepID=A2DK12_TRIV3|nr:armadillo (ARM) repeat-containing protein family [Trichomonas vaginalis G3]EAY19183.1 hypothetical protein TVAG_214080 [Trichomonas vaginalis G3]KAI5548467.1 armadillo (ARM) repeat-containing protein family [Trichomonas vaginalis G3]|eukprot:XP_001580169.1 hypothetical protein [Trichomonas vaginalis G3]
MEDPIAYLKRSVEILISIDSKSNAFVNTVVFLNIFFTEKDRFDTNSLVQTNKELIFHVLNQLISILVNIDQSVTPLFNSLIGNILIHIPDLNFIFDLIHNQNENVFVAGFESFKRVFSSLYPQEAKQALNTITNLLLNEIQKNENEIFLENLFSTFNTAFRGYPRTISNDVLNELLSFSLKNSKNSNFLNPICEFLKSIIDVLPVFATSITEYITNIFIEVGSLNIIKSSDFLIDFFKSVENDRELLVFDSMWQTVFNFILESVNLDNFEVLSDLIFSMCDYFEYQSCLCIENFTGLLDTENYLRSSLIIKFIDHSLEYSRDLEQYYQFSMILTNFNISSSIHYFGSLLDFSDDQIFLEFACNIFNNIEPSEFIDVTDIQRLGFKIIKQNPDDFSVALKIFQLRSFDNSETYKYTKKVMNEASFEVSTELIQIIKNEYYSFYIQDRIFLTEAILQYLDTNKELLSPEIFVEFGNLFLNENNFTEDYSHQFSIPISYFVRNCGQLFESNYPSCIELAINCLKIEDGFEQILDGAILIDELIKENAVPQEFFAEIVQQLSKYTIDKNLRWITRGSCYLAICDIYKSLDIDEFFVNLFNEIYSQKEELFDQDLIDDLETTDAIISLLLSLIQISKSNQNYLQKLLELIVCISKFDEYPENLLNFFLQALIYSFVQCRDEINKIIQQNPQINEIIMKSKNIFPSIYNIIVDLSLYDSN